MFKGNRGIFGQTIAKIAIVALLMQAAAPGFAGSGSAFAADDPPQKGTAPDKITTVDADTCENKDSSDALEHCNAKRLFMGAAVAQAAELLAYTIAATLCAIACGKQTASTKLDDTATGIYSTMMSTGETAEAAVNALQAPMQALTTNVGECAEHTHISKDPGIIQGEANKCTAPPPILALRAPCVAAAAAAVAPAAAIPATCGPAKAGKVALDGAYNAFKEKVAATQKLAKENQAAFNASAKMPVEAPTSLLAIAAGSAAGVGAAVATSVEGTTAMAIGTGSAALAVIGAANGIGDLGAEGAARKSPAYTAYNTTCTKTKTTSANAAADADAALTAFTDAAGTTYAQLVGAYQKAALATEAVADATVAGCGACATATALDFQTDEKAVIVHANAAYAQAEAFTKAAKAVKAPLEAFTKAVDAANAACESAKEARALREASAARCKLASKIALGADVAGGIGTAVLGIVIAKKVDPASTVGTLAGVAGNVMMGGALDNDVKCSNEYIMQILSALMRGGNMAMSIVGAGKEARYAKEQRIAQYAPGQKSAAQPTMNGDGGGGGSGSGDAQGMNGEAPKLLADVSKTDQKKFSAKNLMSNNANATAQDRELLPKLLEEGTGHSADDLNKALLDGQSPVQAIAGIAGASLGSSAPVLANLEASKDEILKEYGDKIGEAVPSKQVASFESGGGGRKAGKSGGDDGMPDLGALLAGLQPKKADEGKPQGPAAPQFNVNNAKKAEANSDGLYPANKSLFDAVGARYQAVQARFLAGETIGSSDRMPASAPVSTGPAPKNLYLKH